MQLPLVAKDSAKRPAMTVPTKQEECGCSCPLTTTSTTTTTTTTDLSACGLRPDYMHSANLQNTTPMSTNNSCMSRESCTSCSGLLGYYEKRLEQSSVRSSPSWPGHLVSWCVSNVYVLLVVLCLVFLPPTLAFNVDLETRVVHAGENGSMFGYSVAQHMDQSTFW